MTVTNARDRIMNMNKAQLIELVKELQAKLANPIPVCPCCLAPMEVVSYSARYDSPFDYWQCACPDVIPIDSYPHFQNKIVKKAMFVE